MGKQIVSTDKAPAAIGAYSQGIISDASRTVYCSGQIAIDPSTGTLSGEDVGNQTDRALKNLKAVLEAAGSSLNKVVKVTVYLKNIGDFEDFNAVYANYFQGSRPARATVEVSNLPKGALIELDAVAEL